ncbi:unnamed protein product [Closterium sp. NIES-65]|nr:unnamed protein product [Closterium sp. NIES-65]
MSLHDKHATRSYKHGSPYGARDITYHMLCDPSPSLPIAALIAPTSHVRNNYLLGAVPPSLTAFSALSELKIQGNYLTGSMPAALPASLKYLDALGNYLVGPFLTTTTTHCSCTSNCFKDNAKCTSGSTQRAADACAICGSTNGTGVLSAALLSVKASLGVSFTCWAVSSPCAVEGVAAPPGAWSNVLCNSAFKPVSLSDTRNFNFNWFAGSIPSALVGIASLTLFGASYNYLYGPVPKLGTALKAIDVPKNWLAGTLPGTGFLSCSASSNCLTSTGACNTTRTTQHPLASCAVCDSPKGTDPICAGGTCAPNTAGPLASSTTPTAPSPILPRFCVGVPLNAAQAVFLLFVKTTLGVTFTEWYASYLTVSPKAKTKAMGWRRLAESEASRERVLLVAPPSGQAGLCTIQGQTPVPGS